MRPALFGFTPNGLPRFYDFDVVGSAEAQRVWVESTLERLE